MGTQIKVWQIKNGGVTPVADTTFAKSFHEADLEKWIVESNILGDDILVIDQQRDLKNVGRLDLLCIDSSGRLVIVELKRGKSSREAVAQALDYASWLNSVDIEVVEQYALQFLGKPLQEAYEEEFDATLPPIDPHEHRILIVAPELDDSAERIVNYLSDRYGIDINAIFFNYAKLEDGQEVLLRSVLVPDELRKQAKSTKTPPTELELNKLAENLEALGEENGRSELIKVCRSVSNQWEERPSNGFGGSFKYAWKPYSRSIFGINVSGDQWDAPKGELDVWITKSALCKFLASDETNLGNAFKSAGLKLVTENSKQWVLRLGKTKDCHQLVQLLSQQAAPKAKTISGN